jgi:hypothetical protein
MYNPQSHSRKLSPTAALPAGFGLFPTKRKASARNSTGIKGPHKIPRRDSQSQKIHTVTASDDSSSDRDNNLRIGVSVNSGLDDDEEEEPEEGKYQARRMSE